MWATGTKDGETEGGRGLKMLVARDSPLWVGDTENLPLPHGDQENLPLQHSDLGLGPRGPGCPQRGLTAQSRARGGGMGPGLLQETGMQGLLLPSRGVGAPPLKPVVLCAKVTLHTCDLL